MRRLHSSPAFRQLHSGSQDCESETKKGTLIVYVDNGNSEVQSMDLVLTQYKITGGDISQIVNLVLDENGTRTEVFNADSTGSLDR